MKAIEMDVLGALTMEGASTTDISRRMFGTIGEWKVKHERARVYSSLMSLEMKGMAVSQYCRPSSRAPKTLYWALPGGYFPEGEPSTKEMILSVLRE